MKTLKTLLAGFAFFLFALGANAQTVGVTFDFAGIDQPWPIAGQYVPFLPHNIAATNLPGGPAITAIANNATDVAYIAQHDGWVHFAGQVWVILDYAIPQPGNGWADLRVFKNGPPGVCGDAPGQRPMKAPIGLNGGSFWWVYVIPIARADYAHAGDSYSFCLYVVANGPDSYIEGNQAHTGLDITQDPP
jgi:hypothetical protein